VKISFMDLKPQMDREAQGGENATFSSPALSASVPLWLNLRIQTVILWAFSPSEADGTSPHGRSGEEPDSLRRRLQSEWEPAERERNLQTAEYVP
jgi:hypothetical protein